MGPEELPRCIYVLPKKQRRCRMLVKEGNQYCGEHAVHEKNNEERILCPNDPKHTVIRKELEKHLKKCNARLIEQPWIIENCNAVVKETKYYEKIDRRPTAEEIEAVFEKIGKCWQDISIEISIEVKAVKEVEKARDEATGADKKKELSQLSSIIGHSQENRVLLNSTENVIVELGAGKGHLTYWMSKKAPLSKYLLVDRSGMRNKYDNRAQNEDPTVKFTRLRCSVEHLDLASIPELQEAKSVAITWKHLCGSGTDAAIRCFKNGHEKGLPIEGFVLAPCCNHKSRIDEYCGLDFLDQYDLSSAGDFAALRHVATWANCGFEETGDGMAEDEGSNKLEVGRKAKKILEYGRSHYLRSLGYKCRLVEYIEPSVTPENMLLVGTR